MRKVRWKFILSTVLVCLLAMGSTAFAFQDIAGEPGKAAINELKKRGIMNGIAKERFGPKEKIDFAQGITSIVRGMGLNIDGIRFIKEPKASDFFTKVPDQAWYAESFIIAQLNGLDLPRDVQPKQQMTREQFAHYLFQGLSATGDYAFIELYVMLNDESKVNPNYMNSIQRLLVSNIAELDKHGNFNPNRKITRAEAAVMLYKAIQFVEEQAKTPQPIDDDVELTTENVNKDIVKVTLSRGEKPNAGYGLEITKIEFRGNDAVICYTTSDPLPDHMYAQVITEPKASVYIDSKYNPIMERDYSATSSVSVQPDGAVSHAVGR